MSVHSYALSIDAYDWLSWAIDYLSERYVESRAMDDCDCEWYGPSMAEVYRLQSIVNG